jgi:peptidyl-prolyl cis-trans isomerase D
MQIHDAIEDERASGKPLAEAAKKANLNVTTIDALDSKGTNKSGKLVELRDADAVLRAVFASDIGVDNEAINTRDNGYVWFEILGIEPAHDRSLEEVKDEIVKAWREDEIRRALTAKAIDLVKALESGEAIEKLANDNGGLKVENARDVRRGGAPNLAPSVVAQIFSLPVGRAGSAAGDGLTRILFKINDAVVPGFDAESEQAVAIAAQLSQSLGNDLLLQYIAKLQADLGVKINGAALNLAVGGGNAY